MQITVGAFITQQDLQKKINCAETYGEADYILQKTAKAYLLDNTHIQKTAVCFEQFCLC